MTGLAMALGVLATLRPTDWADGGSTLLLAGTFLGYGVFAAPLPLEMLFAFAIAVVGLAHLQVFRATATTLLDEAGPESRVAPALRSVFVATLGRVALLGALTFLLSLLVLAAAPVLFLPLRSEVALFLLALGVLMGFLLLPLLREEPISLK